MKDNINLPPRGWEDRSDSACGGWSSITEHMMSNKGNKLIASTPTKDFLFTGALERWGTY